MKKRPYGRPCVVINPAIQGGTPCVGGTRIPAETVALVWWYSRYDADEMIMNWPGLTRGSILVACWYVAKYVRVWQKRWGTWAKHNFESLWYSKFDEVEMPPQAHGPWIVSGGAAEGER